MRMLIIQEILVLNYCNVLDQRTSSAQSSETGFMNELTNSMEQSPS
jgi:hypothetical protein